MLPGHLSAHARGISGDDSIGLVASASEVIDESGNDVPPDRGRARRLGTG